MQASTASARRSTHLDDTQRDRLRGVLLHGVQYLAKQIDGHERVLGALVANPSTDATGFDRAATRAELARLRDARAELQEALGRLDAGTYGLCASCGRELPFERLEAIPHARFCVGCPRERPLWR